VSWFIVVGKFKISKMFKTFSLVVIVSSRSSRPTACLKFIIDLTKMMKAATTLALFPALLYFSETCTAFRPSGKAAFFNMHNNKKKSHFFVRENKPTLSTLTSSLCHDFLPIFRCGGSSSKKGIATTITHKPRKSNSNSSILLASAAKDETTDNAMFSIIISFIGGTTSIVVATSFFIALCYFRNATMVSFWLGAIGNAILSKVLKKLINQSRPPELNTSDMAVVPSDGGMPSSHAMSLAFIGTLTALLLPNTFAMWSATMVRLTLVVYAAISLLYRVQVKKFHTWEQIAVGVAVGACNAVLFYFYLQPSLVTWISATNILNNENGLLPIPMLLIPVIVGLLVVGSVERRIAKWLK
jgi:membrane-associated phospholipid phosphatase